jgi:hypothetical protein
MALQFSAFLFILLAKLNFIRVRIIEKDGI